MQYGFRTRASDEEIDKVLLSLQGKERSEFIRNALYFYVKYKDILDDINSNIMDIKKTLNEIKRSGVNVKDNSQDDIKEPEKDISDSNDILNEMVNSFLNL